MRQAVTVLELREPHDLRAENQAIRARLDRLEQAVFQAHHSTAVPASESSIRGSSNGTPNIARTEAAQADEDSHWLESVCNISVPTHDLATNFLDAYARELDAIQHILHIDSTRDAINRAYADLDAGREADPGVLCLVLGVFACLTFYWSTTGRSWGGELFRGPEPAHKAAAHWAEQALYAMQQMHLATASYTIESVQGMIMLTFLFYHIEGFTARVGLMHSSAITMARSLGLHRTDAPQTVTVTLNQAETITKEVQRKVWWHLACTDWFLAFMGGPQEDTYSMSTRTMHVNLPRNLNPEDLSTRGPEFARSLHEPTLMSYYLQRIRLATTCREIADDLWTKLQFTDPSDIDPQTILALDLKFESQTRELPPFMRLDTSLAQLTESYGEHAATAMDTQRLLIHLVLNTRRCKLHMPFLVRVKTHPHFAASRAAGLQAARTVFEARWHAIQNEKSLIAQQLRLGGLLQHLFFATIVLVMDLCINRDEINGATLVEVRESLQITDDAKESSPMGLRFHESLLNILRKHNVVLPNTTQQAHGLGATEPAANGSNGISVHLPNGFPGTEANEIDFDSMWQDFMNDGPTLDAQTWDAILSDLDVQPI
ncbi:hypothetical protein CBER1_03124 [Cercospora berteroae]|uniref:Xylanolytic transcriptional activator regulatory domain-containing protein n=1 Tax=Cercospora berteroae TaxID=357750 RepID=A0A2S6CK63_9PEZI|nr:hypothetical protein CBER1_03124 [Cercospora berteroae]